MTWRELLTQQVFQKVRAKGQSNPSAEFITAQLTSAQLWEWSRWMRALITYGWTLKGSPKQGRTQSWYQKAWQEMLDVVVLPAERPLNPDIAYFSNGVMAQTPFTATADASTGILTLTWDPSTIGFGKKDTDVLVVGWQNENAAGDQVVGFSELTTYDRGLGTIGLPYGAGIWNAGNVLNVYAAFVATEGEGGVLIEPGTGIASKSYHQAVTVVA